MTGASDSPSNDKQQARQYLSDLFAMNPVWESQQILVRRRKTLELPAVEGTVGEPENYEQQQRQRQQGRDRLKEIQSHYFQLPKDKLLAGLRALPAERYPELAATVSRLSIAADHRESINAMLDDPQVDRDMAIAFGRSLTLAPADAGFAKEQYLQALNRGRNYKKAMNSVRRIEQIDPALIELERDWFTAIRNHRHRWSVTSNISVAVVVGSFVAGMIVRVAIHAFR